ncbi:MAG: hypothetical protein QNJ53_15190 [Pleurocapsa sp. MO_192.B19]|nr:hypothetical protein [Pleurocapsa sp. MO_192.B19]
MTNQNSDRSEANSTSDKQNRDSNPNPIEEKAKIFNLKTFLKLLWLFITEEKAKTFNPKTFPELLWLLIATRQGWRGIFAVSSILVIAIWGAAWLVTNVIPPENKIDIQTVVGTFTYTNGNTRRTVISLSPTGGDKDTPWVETGIKVKKGDVIRITASGRINTAMRTIVTQGIKPGIDDPTWVGPSGLDNSQKRISFPLYDQAKLLPDKGTTYYGFGMLLAAVKDPTGVVKTESIYPFPQDENEPLELTTEKNGELVLTVNDIWLSGDKKDIYVPSFEGEDNKRYYRQLAESEAAFKENIDSWSKETKQKKAYEQYLKREEGWKSIKDNNNWNIWYDDNIGAFSVAIIINP